MSDVVKLFDKPPHRLDEAARTMARRNAAEVGQRAELMEAAAKALRELQAMYLRDAGDAT